MTARLVGIFLGVILAGAFLATGSKPLPAPDSTGAILSECDGQIRAIVIQYVAGADFAAGIYRQFISKLPGDVKIYVVCPTQSDLDELKSSLGPSTDRLIPIFAGHPMTAWSRDRWIALAGKSADDASTLVTPWTELSADIWPQRRGDQQIAADLVRSLAPAVRQMPTGLYFDGGDLLSDDRNVFVTPAVLRRNLQITVKSETELRDKLESLTHHHAIFLKGAPNHHAGMFMMAAGDKRIVVGDPSLAKPLIEKIDLPGGPDLSPETQRKFDSIAAAATQAGYHVIRIPTVPATDEKTYLTYLNGIIDQRDGFRTIYLPQYQGQTRLNAAARQVWESVGYRVVPINVTGAFRFFGTLHCLVNVMQRGPYSSDSISR